MPTTNLVTGGKVAAPAGTPLNQPTPLPPTRSRVRTGLRPPEKPDRLPPPAGWYVYAKAALDFTAALVLALPVGGLVLLTALLVKLTSRGPVFYTQVRLGKGGKPFWIWKVRTMYHECEKTSGPRWATANDPRVTPVGALLRKTHLDELPQLWNVLKGEMSLVGPRPERPEFVPALEKALPNYRDRLLVRPGVTGLAQVQLPADTDLNSVRDKLAYDLFYIRHGSLWMDLRLLAATALKVFAVPYRLLRPLFFLPPRERILSGPSPEPVPVGGA